MGSKSRIEWTETTWNPVTGCSKYSAGCEHCYAERMAHRLKHMGLDRYRNGFQVTTHHDLVDSPRRWSRPRVVFVCSMGDLFHESVPLDFIQRVFDTMAGCRQHVFQVLTKRSRRLRDISAKLTWPDNVWMGVTVEDTRTTYRIRDLLTVPSTVRFLSCEPLLGPLEELSMEGIHWMIVGGESGPGARPMQLEWVESVLHQCREQHIPFFFKQWGGVWKKRTGRVLNGRTYDSLPEAAPAHFESVVIPQQRHMPGR